MHGISIRGQRFAKFVDEELSDPFLASHELDGALAVEQRPAGPERVCSGRELGWYLVFWWKVVDPFVPGRDNREMEERRGEDPGKMVFVRKPDRGRRFWERHVRTKRHSLEFPDTGVPRAKSPRPLGGDMLADVVYDVRDQILFG